MQLTPTSLSQTRPTPLCTSVRYLNLPKNLRTSRNSSNSHVSRISNTDLIQIHSKNNSLNNLLSVALQNGFLEKNTKTDNTYYNDRYHACSRSQKNTDISVKIAPAFKFKDGKITQDSFQENIPTPKRQWKVVN